MRTSNVLKNRLRPALLGVVTVAFMVAQPASAQRVVDSLLPPADMSNSAIDAASGMANLLDGTSGGISRDDLVLALEGAAEAGEPIALWRLGVMYENGEGVAQDHVKAFGYFSTIANDHASTLRHSIQADIVAQAFVKIGDYYRDGLPEAGIKSNMIRSHALLQHAASYFAYAEAQYRVGLLHLDENELGVNPLQSARWLSLAASKGHVLAQATLGDLLFNGHGIDAQPIEGLAWLAVASLNAPGTPEEARVLQMVDEAMSAASIEQRTAALRVADSLSARLSKN